MWIKWTEAIKKNMCGRPVEGDSCEICVGKGEKRRIYKGIVERVLSPRKYIVRYTLSEEYQDYFPGKTSSAIVELSQMTKYFNSIEKEK